MKLNNLVGWPWYHVGHEEMVFMVITSAGHFKGTVKPCAVKLLIQYGFVHFFHVPHDSMAKHMYFPCNEVDVV